MNTNTWTTQEKDTQTWIILNRPYEDVVNLLSVNVNELEITANGFITVTSIETESNNVTEV